jgi:hypothetical protein
MLLFHSAYLVNPSNPVQKIVVWVKVIFSSYFQNKSVWDPPQMGTGTFILFNIPFLLLPPLTVVAIGWYGIRLHKLMGEASDTLGALEQVSAIPTLALFIHTNLLEQVRAIPTIAPFTHRGATNQTNRAKANLFKLYVLLTPEHLGTLPNRTTLFLCPLLNKKDLSLVKETLHALEVIGDARAIPTLKRLSETHTDTDIRETAQRLMYLLEEREALLNHKTHLLRASHAPKEADNSLLRPAYHTPEEAPEELLRPFE